MLGAGQALLVIRTLSEQQAPPAPPRPAPPRPTPRRAAPHRHAPFAPRCPARPRADARAAGGDVPRDAAAARGSGGRRGRRAGAPRDPRHVRVQADGRRRPVLSAAAAGGPRGLRCQPQRWQPKSAPCPPPSTLASQPERVRRSSPARGAGKMGRLSRRKAVSGTNDDSRAQASAVRRGAGRSLLHATGPRGACRSDEQGGATGVARVPRLCKWHERGFIECANAK